MTPPQGTPVPPEHDHRSSHPAEPALLGILAAEEIPADLDTSSLAPLVDECVSCAARLNAMAREQQEVARSLASLSDTGSIPADVATKLHAALAAAGRTLTTGPAAEEVGRLSAPGDERGSDPQPHHARAHGFTGRGFTGRGLTGRGLTGRGLTARGLTTAAGVAVISLASVVGVVVMTQDADEIGGDATAASIAESAESNESNEADLGAAERASADDDASNETVAGLPPLRPSLLAQAQDLAADQPADDLIGPSASDDGVGPSASDDTPCGAVLASDVNEPLVGAAPADHDAGDPGGPVIVLTRAASATNAWLLPTCSASAAEALARSSLD